MKRKKWSVLISAAAVVVAFAGCDASGTTASGSAGTSASAKAFAEKARALVAAASGEIPTHGPTTAPAIEPHKKIVTIPCSAGAQGCKFAVDRFAAAAKAVGWTTTMIDPAGDPAKMAAAVNQAVSEAPTGSTPSPSTPPTSRRRSGQRRRRASTRSASPVSTTRSCCSPPSLTRPSSSRTATSWRPRPSSTRGRISRPSS